MSCADSKFVTLLVGIPNARSTETHCSYINSDDISVKILMLVLINLCLSIAHIRGRSSIMGYDILLNVIIMKYWCLTLLI